MMTIMIDLKKERAYFPKK